MMLPGMVARALLPFVLRIVSWNVRGLGEILENSDKGMKLLSNFKALAPFDLMFLQEHKLSRTEIPFVNRRIGNYRTIWTPCEGQGKGGLAILIGKRYEDKVLNWDIDKENAYIWLKLATPLGVFGIINVYALHKPEGRSRIWRRLQQALEPGIPWTIMGDMNFIERRKDRKGGTRFRYKEEEAWTDIRDVQLGLGDPWVLNPMARTARTVDFSWTNGCKKKPVWQRPDRAYIPLDWMPRVHSIEILDGNFESDHCPLILELAMNSAPPSWARNSYEFFQVNWSVVSSAAGSAGVKDILRKWSSLQGAGPLKRLELALEEIKRFLRALGKELAAERRRREFTLRENLQGLLLKVPETVDAHLPNLMCEIEQVRGQLDVIETHAVRGHKIRAGARWEVDGDRPSGFFFQKLTEKRRKHTMEGLLDDSSFLKTSTAEMKKVVLGMFKKLFSSQGPTAAWRAAWNRVRPRIVSKVSLRQRALLEKPLSDKRTGGCPWCAPG